MSTFASGRPYINGNREQDDNYLLDGLDNNQSDEGDVAYTPSVDAIQEFDLITTNASAEFGNYLGGIINTTLKSGTNEFHGDVFEFFRNDKLNANLWQNNFNHLPRPLLRYNEFGGTAGGPIIKNKLFFFGDYQGERYDQPGTSGGFTVFTAAERPGGGPNGSADFGDLCTSIGGTFSSAGVCSTASGPALQSLFEFFANYSHDIPLQPNSRQFDQPGSSQNSFFIALSCADQRQPDQQSGERCPFLYECRSRRYQSRLGCQDKDHVYGRYTQQYVTNPTTNSQPLLFNSSNVFPLYAGVLDWTHTFGPTFVNDVRAGVNYFPISSYSTVSATARGKICLRCSESRACPPRSYPPLI